MDITTPQKKQHEIDIEKILNLKGLIDDKDDFEYGEYRKIVISSDVDCDLAKMVIDAINRINFYDDKKEKENEKKKYIREPIELQINSNGGVIYDGFAIIAAMLSSKTPVDTTVYGQAMSMGLMIALCGRHRKIHKYAIIMYHELSGGHGASDKLEVQKREVAESIRLQKLLDKIVLERTKLKKTKLDEVKKLAADLYITAKQAKDFGIVHEVI